MLKVFNINKITAVAITFNNEKYIKSFVNSLSFVDEIIIIDCFSTDKTKQVANELGIKFFEKNLNSISEYKNFGISEAKNDWILFLNVSDSISPLLQLELKNINLNSSLSKTYSVKRNFLFMGTQVNYGNLQNNAVTLLFNRNYCSYNETIFDDLLKNTGLVTRLKYNLDNYCYQDFDSYTDYLNYYSSINAKFLYLKNVKPTFCHLILKPFFQLFYNYIIKLGFLDKKEGFILAYLQSFATFKTYLQLWMLYRKIE